MAEENRKDGNLFDKIFRENARDLFLPLVSARLGGKIVYIESLEPRFVKTLEREVDFLFDVKLDSGKEFVLHMEFQTRYDRRMLYRMSEYHALVLSKYQKPVRHFLIYLGVRKSTMPSELPGDQVFSRFEVVNLSSLDYQELLQSQIPEELILTILADYPKKLSEEVLRSIIVRLRQISGDTALLKKYLHQLINLSRLRKADQITIKLIEDMPLTIDIEKDYLYNRGVKKGREEGREEGLHKKSRSVILATFNEGIPLASIARFVQLSEEEVRKVLRKEGLLKD